MDYVVLDLEWNQSNTGKEDAVEKLPFEIIEIGAIKLNKERVMVSEFNELIKPQVYHEMHKITSKLIHIQMQELERGRPFPEVGGDFVRWCGQEEQLFCTWGTLDLTELQRNMAYYEMPLLAPGPLPYLDVQKLFAIAYEERKIRRNLEYAIDFLHIEKDIPFHRAFSDAYYTAKILIRILEEHPEVVVNLSYDTFCPQKDRRDEIKEQFDTYHKLLEEWNKVMNLTGITEYEEVVEKHYVDSLSIVKVMDMNHVDTVIDVGTGAGFPGLPLKIAFPHLKVTLLDSLNKRIKFLNTVIEELGLEDIHTIHGRAEDYAKDAAYREKYDLCVSRAVANLATLSEYCLPYVKVGGMFIPYKSGEIDEEVKGSKKAVKVLGGEIEDVVKFELPGTDIGRSFVKIHKVKNTAKKYPRKAGMPSREPIV